MRCCILPTILTLAFASAHAAEPLMNCRDQAVQYSEHNALSLEGHVSVRSLPQRPDRVLKERYKDFTPEADQQTVAFNRVVVADTMQPGPYSNVIDVFSTRGPVVAWRIEISEIGDNARLRWINDDLLFIQAWRGRIVSTDLIFEVSSGRFVYAREANYGMLVEPCEDTESPAAGAGS